MSGIAIAFILYFLAIVVIAVYTMRGIGSTMDFLLGGRKIGVVGTAISAAQELARSVPTRHKRCRSAGRCASWRRQLHGRGGTR